MYKPKKGERWTHYNGIEYEVMHIANKNSVNYDFPETVVYQNINNDKVYAKKMLDWHRSMKPTYKESNDEKL